MAIVIDASVAIAWRLRDREGTPYSAAVIERIEGEEAVVPDLFWHEVRTSWWVRSGGIALKRTHPRLTLSPCVCYQFQQTAVRMMAKLPCLRAATT